MHVLNDALVEDATSNTVPPSSEVTEQFQESIERFGQLGCEEHPEAKDAHLLARACHLNLVIFYHLVVNKIPHRHTSNQKYADGLFSAIRGIPDKTWNDIPYLRLWM